MFSGCGRARMWVQHVVGHRDEDKTEQKLSVWRGNIRSLRGRVARIAIVDYLQARMPIPENSTFDAVDLPCFA